jgi:AhpD family alkylhydroperoxidase
MARIPYADEAAGNDIAALAAQIRAERDGRIPNIYRMLLNSPPIAQGWLNLLTAIRHESTLAGRYREMVIIRIAVINGAEYERLIHVPIARKEGVSDAQIDAIGNWQNANVFDDADRAVLGYTDAMTRDVRVANDVFAAVKQHFDVRTITELTATVAAYNLVSRFLEALQIDHEK